MLWLNSVEFFPLSQMHYYDMRQRKVKNQTGLKEKLNHNIDKSATCTCTSAAETRSLAPFTDFVIELLAFGMVKCQMPELYFFIVHDLVLERN